MNKYNIVLTLALALLFSGCASFQPKYAEGEKTENFNFPTEKEIDQTFYFIGDAGYSPPGGISPGLLALKQHFDSVETKKDMIVFLGDNIYPDGMPRNDGSVERTRAEYRIDAQLDALESFEGNILFIPGNHEWYNEGIKGLKREAEYIKTQLEKSKDSMKIEDVWAPTPGCGLEIRKLSDDIVLFIMDSQWFLENWDSHPRINANCEELKTREAVLMELESELGDYPEATKIFLLHHPVHSNGIHGGQYTLYRHLYPAPGFIPLPVLGSFATLLRTTGGVSIQDLQNERYQKLRNRLIVLTRDTERLVFASGHEHSLQYIEHGNIKQIVSGAGAKSTYATLSEDGLFAYPGQGFAKLDVFEDGSSWVSYYGAIDNQPKLLYQTEVIPPLEVFKPDVSHLPDDFPKTVRKSIYPPEQTNKSELHESIFGDFYRKLYSRKIEARVADLDTLYGGLEVLSSGGGHQTISLKVEDSLGRQYEFRRIEKSAIQFLQTTAFKTTVVESRFKNTLAERFLKDFYTAQHPYIFTVIPTLAEAADLYYLTPEIYYLPKQPELGRYNEKFGDQLYILVEEPGEEWVETSDKWGNPNEDIENTAGLYSRLRRDEDYSVNEEMFIRARLFDMLIGDWDRHEGQWAWAEHEDEEGNHYFEPIPVDRDQAFSNFDGAFLGTLRGLTGFADQFGKYGPTIDDIKWFNAAALGIDRSLIQDHGREEWIEQAKYLQENLTDEIIEEAFSKLPPETQGEISQRLVEDLKARRGNIVNIAKRYYGYMAGLGIVTGTDKDDYFMITRLPEGKTNITVSRIKDGEIADTISDFTYDSEYTEEIWVYGLDDDDVFEVRGKGDNLIDLKIIGGHNNDIYIMKNLPDGKAGGRDVKIYDYESMPNTFKEVGKAELELSDDYQENHYNKYKRIHNTNLILPGFGYNPDDGFKIMVQDVYTVNGFERDPFTTQHRFGFAYYFATSGFELNYDVEFVGVIEEYHVSLGANFTSPNYTHNFFGFGNETENPEDKLGKDYNRVRLSRIGMNAGILRNTPFGGFFQYMASFQSVEVEATANRILVEEFVQDPESPFYDRKYFAGLEALYRYESYDDPLNPTRGMKFELALGGKMNVENADRVFVYIEPHLEFYNAVSKNRKFVLNTHVDSKFLIGDGYEFYQAAQLGGNTGLRGYREQRFTGETYFATGADLRYSFNEFTTGFLPFQIGLFVGADVGRVWADEAFSNSEKWHNDYGGGVFIISSEAINGTFQLFNGEEGLRFSFVFGFRF